MHSALCERMNTMLRAQNISGSKDGTELKRVWVRVRLVHVVLGCEIGSVVVSMSGHGRVCGEDEAREKYDAEEEGEDDPYSICDAESLLVEARLFFGVGVGRVGEGT